VHAVAVVRIFVISSVTRNFCAHFRLFQALVTDGFRSKPPLLPEDSEQEVFGSDVPVAQAPCLAGSICQQDLAVLTERQVLTFRNWRAEGYVALDSVANSLSFIYWDKSADRMVRSVKQSQ